jgi:hypothetical protein
MLVPATLLAKQQTAPRTLPAIRGFQQISIFHAVSDQLREELTNHSKAQRAHEGRNNPGISVDVKVGRA